MIFNMRRNPGSPRPPSGGRGNQVGKTPRRPQLRMQKDESIWRERNPAEAGGFTKEEWAEEMNSYGIDGIEITKLRVNCILVAAAMPGPRWDQNVDA